jgi:hypothetical protein
MNYDKDKYNSEGSTLFSSSVHNIKLKGEQPCKFFEQLLINIFKLVIIPIVVKTVDHIQNS